MKISPRHSLCPLALVLFLVLAQGSTTTRAQFLFTYEINQEDDSRAPKSSLFDPSSFKIVTPSQLQSSYQKISSQLDSAAVAVEAQQSAPAAPAPDSSAAMDDSSSSSSISSGSSSQSPIMSPRSSTTSATVNEQPQSLLKQTSAALQSFAELFSLTSPTSSPSPLSALQPPVQHHLATNNVDQQAEARSLHEHWTQQQQKSHQQQQPALNSLVVPSPHQHLTSQHQPTIASAALNSFTTTPTTHHHTQHHNHHLQPQQHQSTGGQVSHQPQQSQASYWLTASPLNAPDGNYLVQIKQQQQQQQQQEQTNNNQANQNTVPTSANLVDNFLSVGHHRSHVQQTTPTTTTLTALSQRQQQQQVAKPATTATMANLAQASFLSTPTSYYPSPSVESSTPRQIHHNHHHHQSTGAHHATPQFSGAEQQFVSPPTSLSSSSSMQTRGLTPSFVSGGAHTAVPLAQSQLQNLRNEVLESAQLQPPANIPENFVSAALTAATGQPHVHKSAEESLISFRQQQQQHDQQSALFAAQQQLANNQVNQQQQQHSNELPSAQQSFTGSSSSSNSGSSSSSSSSSSHHNQRQTYHQPQHHQAASTHQNDIPKVSPQIYESFLLQQRDQHEKHMELLKQQQELNKLLEQKHKQQEAELKRKRKKQEELEKEARKKALKEQELARKLKLEQEERELRRRRDEEERKRAEERRYREYLEAREREKRDKEAALQLKRQRQAEEEQLQQQQREQRELKLRLEREKAEMAELAERRKQQAAELQATEQQNKKNNKQDKEQEDAKYVNYLRQQEELRKLLELKQKEDELQQQRRRQASVSQQHQQQHQQQQRVSQTTRANKLALELRERTGNSGPSSWGVPIRGARMSSTQSLSTTEMSISPTVSPTTQSTPMSSSSSSTPVASTQNDHRHRSARLVKKQRTLGDEKLIRQKIPMYSGPGQYGLYRGGSNDSLANDLAALLDSVTLPVSSTTTSTTTTTTTTTTTPAPSDAIRPTTRYYDVVDQSSSLSPLLQRSSIFSSQGDRPQVSSEQPAANEPLFDDDVPRRPARGLSTRHQQQQQGARQSPLAAASTTNRQQTTRFHNESSQGSPSGTGRAAHIGLASLPPDSDNDGIPGRAGVEYPVLSSVPPTSFSCSKQPLNGYYADTETACQVVHLCQGGVQSSILCPNGTIFNQEKFSCQWWYEVNCSRAPIFYQLNDNLYKSLPSESSDTDTNNKQKAKARNKQTTADKGTHTNLLSSGAAAAA